MTHEVRAAEELNPNVPREELFENWKKQLTPLLDNFEDLEFSELLMGELELEDLISRNKKLVRSRPSFEDDDNLQDAVEDFADRAKSVLSTLRKVRPCLVFEKRLPAKVEKYEITAERISKGSHSVIYQCKDTETGERLVAKVVVDPDYDDEDEKLLDEEYRILRELEGHGFPRACWLGKVKGRPTLILERLGPDFSYLKRQSDLHALKTSDVLRTGINILAQLEVLHEKGYVHRSIKPENFCVGYGDSLEDLRTIRLIDVGGSEKFSDEPKNDNNEHQFSLDMLYTNKLSREQIQKFEDVSDTKCDYSPSSKTYLYLGIDTYLGNTYFPKDDVEALGYALIFLCRGSFPWSDDDSLRGRLTTPLEDLCTDFRGRPVPELVSYMKAVHSLPRTRLQEKHYELLRRCLISSSNSPVIQDVEEPRS